MTPDEFWTTIRFVNMTFAGLASVALLIRHILKDYRHLQPYQRSASQALTAYGVAYCIAAALAQANHVVVGAWTGVMTIPIIWHLFAAFMDDDEKEVKINERRTRKA